MSGSDRPPQGTYGVGQYPGNPAAQLSAGFGLGPKAPVGAPPIQSGGLAVCAVVSLPFLAIGFLFVPMVGPLIRSNQGVGLLYSLAILCLAVLLVIAASRRSLHPTAQELHERGYPLTDPRLYPAAAVTLGTAIEAEWATNVATRTQQWPPTAVPMRALTAARKRALAGKRIVVATWGLGDFPIVLFCWLTLSVVGGLMSASITRSTGVGSTIAGVSTVIAVMIPWISLAGWPWFITMLRGNGLWIDFGLRRSWTDVGWGLVYGFAAIAVAVGLGWLTTFAFGDFNSSAGELGDDLSSNKMVLFMFALTLAIGAPFVEEVCFRGLFFSAIAKRGVAPWISVVISALVFATFHLEPIRILLLFGIGLVLGFARWHTGSITTSFVAHMVNNSLGAMSLLIS